MKNENVLSIFKEQICHLVPVTGCQGYLARHHACLHNSTCWDYFCLGPSIQLIQKIELVFKRTRQNISGSDPMPL